ncbi:hypothetical protein [Thalassovita taeanensis]|uniref:hypothetical protein n=1 Tax=Thalassovita taeanensis TaxID=657014 RepID=UPI000AFA135E|nr:hypothetical protein [Thalassovita taeanensis]
MRGEILGAERRRFWHDDDKLEIVMSVDGGDTPVPAVSAPLTKSDAASADPIEIEIGQVTIRLDGTTSSDRIAEIVRAIGSRP